MKQTKNSKKLIRIERAKEAKRLRFDNIAIAILGQRSGKENVLNMGKQRGCILSIY